MKRQYSIDVIKIAATLLIVFHHYQQITETFFEGGINFFNGRFYFGYIVELFFVISGYFTYRYAQKIQDGLTFPEFFTRRALRLLPLVAISGIAFELFSFAYQRLYQQPFWGISLSLWGTIINGLGIQEGWGLANPYINNPTWYISVLLLCYLLFYMLTYLGKRWQIPAVYLYITMIFLGMGTCTYGFNLPLLNWPAARGYYSFFFGIVFARQTEGQQTTRVQCLCCLSVILVMTYLIIYHHSIVSNGLQYLMTFFYYPALILLARSPLAQKCFCHSCIGTLGEISFNVYIWHTPLFILMYIVIHLFHLTINLHSYKAMFCYSALCFVAGIFSYYFLEKPLDIHLPRMLKKFCSTKSAPTERKN